jgi:hypothetical protein
MVYGASHRAGQQGKSGSLLYLYSKSLTIIIHWYALIQGAVGLSLMFLAYLYNRTIRVIRKDELRRVNMN